MDFPQDVCHLSKKRLLKPVSAVERKQISWFTGEKPTKRELNVSQINMMRALPILEVPSSCSNMKKKPTFREKIVIMKKLRELHHIM